MPRARRDLNPTKASSSSSAKKKELVFTNEFVRFLSPSHLLKSIIFFFLKSVQLIRVKDILLCCHREMKYNCFFTWLNTFAMLSGNCIIFVDDNTKICTQSLNTSFSDLETADLEVSTTEIYTVEPR